MNHAMERAGQDSGWLCAICHRKVVTSAAPSHSMYPVLITLKGKARLAHNKCVERTQEKQAAMTPPADNVVSFRDSSTSIREAAELRAQVGAAFDLFRMADIQVGSDLVATLAGHLDVYNAMRDEAISLRAKASGVDTAAMKAQVATLTKERDEARECLAEAKVLNERLLAKEAAAQPAVTLLSALRLALGVEKS